MLARSLAFAAALLASACATPSEDTAAAPGARDCFFASQINGYNYIDSNHIGVTVGANRRYSFEVSPPNVRELAFGNQLAVVSDLSSICTGRLTGVHIVGGDPAFRWYVSEVVRLADEAPAGS